MRSITEHLETSLMLESFKKVDSRLSNYDTYLIYEHALDGSELDEQTFVKLMKDDIKEAQKIFTKTMIPLIGQREKKNHEHWFDWVMRNAKDYAEKKWKTDKRRQEYYTSEIKKFNDKYNSMDIRKAFIDSMHYNFGTDSYCQHVLDLNSLDANLRHMWKENEHIFEACGGWMFLIDTAKGDMAYNFGIYIDVILDDDAYKARQAGRDAHDKAIADYYASKGSGGYTGD